MIGKTISHYQILEKLGEGGMGVVYKARDVKLDRLVALKFLPVSVGLDEKSKNRFISEAKTASALQHTNICTIHEIDEADTGQIFICMDYYQGETLKDKIKRGPLSLKESITIMVQITQGILKAHEEGIIHRDIKPANIIICEDGTVKIIDFGLARLTGKDRVLETTSMVGTLAYMSPQQICAEKVDERTDIWSLGVLFYEMLTGNLPFKGEYQQAIVYSIFAETPPSPSSFNHNLPKKLDQIINKALQKDPNFRYQKTKLFLNDLLEIETDLLERNKIIEDKKRQGIKKIPEMLGQIIHRRSNFTFYLVVLSALLFLIILLGILIPKPKYVKNTLVFENTKIINQNNPDHLLITDMYEYLIKDEILQSSSKNILLRSEFDYLYPKEKPELTIKNTIHFQPIGFKVEISTINHQRSPLIACFSNVETYTFKIFDPSILLTSTKLEISKKILKNLDITNLKASSFTESWDAFRHFYQGEKSWQKLDITAAQRSFEASLNIDPNFILAKLRLADVLQYGINRVTSQELVFSIRPNLYLLSEIDSLKAEALIARVSGRQRKAISILRKIYDRCPSRKEAAFDVAEAYYNEICEINDAEEFYRKCITLDKTFSLAHNHLAYCYSHKGLHDQALRHYKIYLELDTTANAYDSMGDGYMAAGKLDSAIWAKKKGIDKDPKLLYLYRGLTWLQIMTGHFKESLTCVEKYQRYSIAREHTSRAYFYKALIEYANGNCDLALKHCLQARKIFDTRDLITRNHDLHWLMGMIYLKIGQFENAELELHEMQEIAKENNVNATNYQLNLYKFMRHLESCFAADKGNTSGLLEIVKEFDDPIKIKYKVKDHNSHFDLAYFNTSLGKLFMHRNINRLDYAEERFKKALLYNQNYGMAYYNLWKLYQKQNRKDEAEEEYRQFFELCRGMGPDIDKVDNLFSPFSM